MQWEKKGGLRYFMVTLRLKDSSIYQGFTTSILKCPTVNIFFLSKQSWKIILKSRIFHHSSSFSDNIIFFKYLLLFCIIVFTASLLRIFVQCYDVYVQLHGNFSNSETSHHRHKTRRRRKRKTTRKMRKRTKKWDGVIPPNKWECVNIGLYFQLFDEVKSF